MSFLVVLVETIDGDSWFTWWFNHLAGPSICNKRPPMVASLFQLFESVPLNRLGPLFPCGERRE